MALFTLPGRMELVLLDTAPAVLTAPTVTELNAGQDLIGAHGSEELAEFPDWMATPNTTPVPGYASHKVGAVGGDITFPNMELAWWKDDTVEAIYSAVEAGTLCWVAICRDGITATEEVQLLTCQVLTKQRTNAREGANQFRSVFAVQAENVGAIGAGA